MSRSHSTQAIVLRSYDISDADRFYVVLTEKLGKIAARAKGARKPLSRLGGRLGLYTEVELELHEGRGGWLVTGAAQRSAISDQRLALEVTQLVHLQQGIELILNLIEDEHPEPGLFELTTTFIHSTPSSITTLSFSFALLKLLGLLPDGSSEDIRHLNASQKEFIATSSRGELVSEWTFERGEMEGLSGLRKILVTDHTHRKMRVEEMLTHLSA